MGSFVRISVLAWADLLAGYALWVMVNYLTKVWKINFTHAAAIVNFFTGAAAIMPIGMAFLVHALRSDFWMLLLSSLSFSFGMSFLAMSMPPVLSEVAGNCSAYKPYCIGNTQKVLFYTALALIAVGLAGHMTSLESFLNFQTKDKEPDVKKGDCKDPLRIVGAFAVILFALIGGIALPYIKSWSVQFGIPAICTVVATLLFLSGSCGPCSYNRDKSEMGSITPLFKIIIRMIPMWMAFIMCGVVSSIGNTYFLEQASNMNRKVGHLRVPLQIFKIFYDMAKSFAPSFLGEEESSKQASTGGSGGIESQRQPSRAEKGLAKTASTIGIVGRKAEKGLAKTASTLGIVGRKAGKEASTVGFVLAMIFSILCCITAAKVETRRLGMIKRHGFLDKPDEKIPMSMFWLLPQFLLLGALDGLFEKSIDRFISNHNLPSRYLQIFSNAVKGTGIMGSILIVYITGKVSESGGKPSWFQDTLNKSHLDNYYWLLSALSSINLVLFSLVAYWCPYQGLESGGDGKAQGNAQENGEAQGNGET